ncbi:MAG: hypothetical protein IPI28_02135 [Candidatus Omnitrophica bacterium]|nr:hypothetical protein [Candidatus Omnitrophota bacterium]
MLDPLIEVFPTKGGEYNPAAGHHHQNDPENLPADCRTIIFPVKSCHQRAAQAEKNSGQCGGHGVGEGGRCQCCQQNAYSPEKHRDGGLDIPLADQCMCIGGIKNRQPQTPVASRCNQRFLAGGTMEIFDRDQE